MTITNHPFGPPPSHAPRSELAPEPISIEDLAVKFIQLLDYLGVSWSEDENRFVPTARMPSRSSQQGPENVEPVVSPGP